MVKEPSEKDETLLLEYSKSADKKLASEAKCLLAGYYVKKEQYEKSNRIFEKSNSQLFNDTELGLQLSYWRIISNIENGLPLDVKDVNQLATIQTSNLAVLKNDLCNRYTDNPALSFCNESSRNTKDTGVISATPLIMDNATGSQFEQIAENEKIVVQNASMRDGLVKGLLYSFKENSLSFEISQVEDNLSNVVVIDGKKKTMSYKGEELSFGQPLGKDGDMIFNHVWNKNPDMVVIGINDRTISPGVKLKSSLEEVGIQTILLNFEVPDFRKKLGIIDEEYSDKYIYFVGFGTEQSMTEFVPIVKFMSETPEEVEICVVTDMLSGLYFSEQFRNYFKSVEVMTYIEINGNYWSKRFQNGYTYFYDEDPDANALIGFDMALKLKTYIDKRTKEDYVSNIESFTNDRADRLLKIYQIIDYNKVVRLQ